MKSVFTECSCLCLYVYAICVSVFVDTVWYEIIASKICVLRGRDIAVAHDLVSGSGGFETNVIKPGLTMLSVSIQSE